MSGVAREMLLYAMHPAVLRRSALIALVVGGVLSTVNQGGIILRGPWTASLFAKIVFNCLVPFIVSSISAVANREKRP